MALDTVAGNPCPMMPVWLGAILIIAALIVGVVWLGKAFWLGKAKSLQDIPNDDESYFVLEAFVGRDVTVHLILYKNEETTFYVIGGCEISSLEIKIHGLASGLRIMKQRTCKFKSDEGTVWVEILPQTS